MRLLVLLLGLASSLGACARSQPPNAACIDGEYMLKDVVKGADDVRLVISGSTYRLTFRGDTLVGSFKYNRYGKPPVFEFTPEHGRISQRNLSFAPSSYLSAFDEGRIGTAYEVTQEVSGGKTIIVYLDYDGTYFWKSGC